MKLRTKSIVLLSIIGVGVVAVSFWLINSFFSNLQREDLLFDDLKVFVMTATFTPMIDSIYPEPERVTPELYRFAEKNYENDEQIRKLLAHYFLKYDSVLLKRGLLTVGGSGEDLITLLWSKEALRNTYFKESPAALEMRNHIEINASWFSLSSDETNLLDLNKQEFSMLQASWQAP